MPQITMLDNYGYTYSADENYCYPNSAVLVNKLNIRDGTQLASVERDITYLRLIELQKTPIHGQFGFSHLRTIHRYIFTDLYSWAGEIRRSEFLMKGGTIFCRGQYIESYAQDLFSKLASEHKLRGMQKVQFVERLAYYMGEVNALHPFREGNGRTSREFFRQLSKSAGYDLDFGNIDKNDLLAADIAAFDKDYSLLITILNASIHEP